MELAYRLAVSDEPYIQQIRDNVIVSITGATDVDGRDRYVDWYYAYKIDELYDGGENYGEPALLGQVRLPRQQPRHQLRRRLAARAPQRGI